MDIVNDSSADNADAGESGSRRAGLHVFLPNRHQHRLRRRVRRRPGHDQLAVPRIYDWRRLADAVPDTMTNAAHAFLPRASAVETGKAEWRMKNLQSGLGSRLCIMPLRPIGHGSNGVASILLTFAANTGRRKKLRDHTTTNSTACIVAFICHLSTPPIATPLRPRWPQCGHCAGAIQKETEKTPGSAAGSDRWRSGAGAAGAPRTARPQAPPQTLPVTQSPASFDEGTPAPQQIPQKQDSYLSAIQD